MRTTRLLLAGLLISATAACGAPPPAKAADVAAAEKAPAVKPVEKAMTEAEFAKAAADAAPAEDTVPEGNEDGDCKGQSCITKCDKKAEPRNCLEAGEALRMGNDGVTASAPKAIPYLEKACTLKEREGCYRLGDMYSTGEEGVPADDAKAIPLFTTACDLGRGDACDKLSKRAESGDGMKKDHVKAIAFLAKGCAADDYQIWTCNSFKKAIEAKDKEAVKAIASWKKACAKKDDTACTGLDRVGGK